MLIITEQQVILFMADNYMVNNIAKVKPNIPKVGPLLHETSDKQAVWTVE